MSFKDLIFWIPDALVSIKHQLNRIEERQKTMQNDEAALKAALADLISTVKNEFTNQTQVIDTAVQAIIDKIAAGNTTDFSEEMATIAQAKQDFIGNIDSIAGQLPTTPTPPSQPVTPPSETTATEGAEASTFGS